MYITTYLIRLVCGLAPIQRAAHPTTAAVQHVGVDLRGAYILVAEQFLYGTDVVAILDQVRSESVPQGVRAGSLADPGTPDGLAHGLLQRAW